MTSDDLAPAAWRYLIHGEWFVTNIRGAAEFRQSEGCVVDPLYTAIAQSDAEQSGLMRARTIALEQRCERGTPWDVTCVTIANKIGEQFGCPPIPTPALTQSDVEPVADIDLAIDKVRLFRLERMDDGVIWIRLYREGGEDQVIWLNSRSAISAIVEDDKDEPIAQSNAEPKQDMRALLDYAIESIHASYQHTHAKKSRIWADDASMASEHDEQAQSALDQVRAALAQSDSTDFGRMRVTKFLGGSDDNFERYQNARISNLEREIAKLTSDANMDPVTWKLVPKEPTTEMIVAAFDKVELRPNASPQFPNNEARRLIYKAMVVAAPVPPHPNASAGLIEAVELFLSKRMREFTDSRAVDSDLVALAGVLAGDTDGEGLTFLRSRAADRSGK